MDRGRLQEQVTVITGAASGIGKASVELFAREGAKLLIVDRNEEQLHLLTAQLNKEGYSVLPVLADLGKESDCKVVVDTAIETYGRLDVLFNNAGITVPKVLHETSTEEYRKLIDVNVSSVFWCCKYAIPYMLEQGKGVILTTSSKTGIVAQRNSAIYCSTKGALISMMQAIALDYATKGIRANSLCPGIIDTALVAYEASQAADPSAFRKQIDAAQPIGRLGTPEECAQAALFLCSDQSSFITGVSLPVDGGFTAQ